MGRALAISFVLVGLVGCNRYELFRLAGYQQESFSNKADILFIIDNSNSMTDEATALAANFKQFIELLQTQEEEIVREDLGDAVENYKDYVVNRGAFVDFQIGITTTEIANGWGELKGAPGQELLVRGDEALADKFIENLLCHATCFNKDPDDPVITADYLDNLCGAGNWKDVNCASSGYEEGLEAAFMSLCRAVPNPPEECFEPTVARTQITFEVDTADTGGFELPDDTGVPMETLFTDAHVLSNAGLTRNNATFIPVIVSDEGDDSRRESTGDEFPKNYEKLFTKFNRRLSWVTITQPLDESFEAPPGCFGYTEWGVFRYDFMVRISGGLKIPLSQSVGGDCLPTDFGENLNQFGQLLQNLLTVFELQSVPDPDSLLVFVDKQEVARAEVLQTDAYGLPIYNDGWSYEPSVNAIRFHGAAIPPNDAVVQVYYEPVDGMPRGLPF